MELVEHDRLEVAQQRVLLQPRGQDSFGGKEHARVGAELPLEPDVPADFLADPPALLLGNAARHRACRDTPRLEHDDWSVHRKRGRHASGLSGPRRR